MQSCHCSESAPLSPRIHLPEAETRELERFIANLPAKDGHLVTALHKAQSLYGYLPVEAQKTVARLMGTSLSQVYGVVSFYSYFSMLPKGRYPISICKGTACFVQGAEKVIDSFKAELGVEIGEVTADGRFSIDVLRCVGACALAPVLTVGEKTYTAVTADQVKEILAHFDAEQE
ncbi:NAD(P)H-dependent oxidoreductase subunit E [Geomonas sp. RF6]|uniref:NADH-quinone oxidoreductase subunit NuoE family protein n=1 Tax=Geomonas sp. RF6 TaxID=2897342 RepID=UPI001E345A4E|nr:NAD(P)H-dependent oxidoreductase subunit E [Geomonas sp. RF6]UFS70393.1 NAD(P)H-dependent oxidoreductase subunit E [Geomonas sp. RF6]